MSRSRTESNKARSGWHAVQGKNLRPHYSEKKFTELLARRKAAGMYYEDPDFPGDEEDSCPEFGASCQ